MKGLSTHPWIHWNVDWDIAQESTHYFESQIRDLDRSPPE
jgi:hypothetical protein